MRKIVAESDPSLAEHTAARNTAFAFAVQVTTSVFTAGLTLFLVRALDPGGYGLFALALSIGALVLIPSDFGISHSAARFMAERRGELGAVVEIFADALKLKLVASGLGSAALFATAGPISAAYGEGGLAWPLRAIAISVFAQSLMLFFTSAFTALGRVDVNLRIVSAESAVELGASVVLVLLGGGVVGATFGRTAGYAFGAAFAAAVAVRRLGPGIFARRRIDRGRARQIGVYASALAVVDGAYTIYSQLGILLVGAYYSTVSVGLYTAAFRMISLLQYPGLSVASGVAPRLARHAQGGAEVRTLERAFRLMIVLQAAFVPPLLVWSRPMVHLLLGGDYDRSAHVIEVLAPSVFMTGLAPLASLAVNFLGDARRRIPIALGALAVDLALNLILIPRYGLTGAAIAANVSYGIYLPGHIWICRRIIRLPLLPILITLGRAALAAGLAALVLLAVGRDDLTAFDWVLGGAGALGAYVATLLLSREISLHDLRAGGASARRLVRLAPR